MASGEKKKKAKPDDEVDAEALSGHLNDIKAEKALTLLKLIEELGSVAKEIEKILDIHGRDGNG